MNNRSFSGNKVTKHVRYVLTPDAIRRMVGHCDMRLTERWKESIEGHAANPPSLITRPIATTTRQVEITPAVLEALRSMTESRVASFPSSL